MATELTEIPEAFRPYVERGKPPGAPAAPAATGDAPRWRIVIDFDTATQAINADLPDGWGTGDWYRLLLLMVGKYGNQLVDAATRLEAEAKGRADG